MAKIFIDGKEFEVNGSENLLHACISLKLDLPYFCWHPALGSVGACRQCAVIKYRDENDTQGKLVMACMEPVTEGTRISLNAPDARQMRENVIEWLMTNHPHDCPVCDEGGECHLQDMTVMTGHNYRRFSFPKRTYRNQYLGPFINHEMNRCIQCYRCVRFYRDYAGGKDLDVFGPHNHIYFGRQEDGVLESEFSGNLVEVCPTGVFTDKTLKQHYARKWDLQTAPSVCTHCGLGCNIIPGERYGKLVRILSRYNGAVNGYFICDRGRFGYEFVNSPERIRQPLQRSGPGETPAPLPADDMLKKIKPALSNRQKVVGIGSPRASLESNYALRKLVGADRFFAGMADDELARTNAIINFLKNGPARIPSLKEVESADAVLVLGEDVTNTAPMLALALRQSIRQQPMTLAEQTKIPEWHDAAVRELVQDQRGPLFIATPAATKLDNIATETLRATPDDLARLGFAVANILDAKAPTVKDLSKEIKSLAQNIADKLGAAKKPLVVCGGSCGSMELIQAAANVARALCREDRPAHIFYTAPENNTTGLAMMQPKPLGEALKLLNSGSVETLIVLENDLFSRVAPSKLTPALQKAKQIISLDYLPNRTNDRAHFMLPSGTFAESDGTLVNNEGRAQRFYQAMPPKDDVQESWRWLQAMMQTAGLPDAPKWSNLGEVVAEIAKSLPQFKGIDTLTPPPGFRVNGQKIPRQSHRYSGRTAMNANINVSEPKPPDDPDSPLSFSMEGYQGEPPASLIPRFWSPGWNSVQSISKFQSEVGGPLHGGDPGLRLIEPGKGDATYFDGVPEKFQPRDGEWLLLPHYHIFGSEPLSAQVPAVAERIPQPYLGMHPKDAEKMKLADGDMVTVSAAGSSQQLPVKLIAAMPQGALLLPVGLTDFDECVLPSWGEVKGKEKGKS